MYVTRITLSLALFCSDMNCDLKSQLGYRTPDSSLLLPIHYSTDILLSSMGAMPPAAAAAAVPALFLRLFSISLELDVLGFLTVKGLSLTRISFSAFVISCCTSGHCSFWSFSTWVVSRGVCGTAVYCCRYKFGRLTLLY